MFDDTTGISPVGDYRFAPNNEWNKDPATDIAAWVFSEPLGSPTWWADYPITTVEGAHEFLAAGAAGALALFLSF